MDTNVLAATNDAYALQENIEQSQDTSLPVYSKVMKSTSVNDDVNAAYSNVITSVTPNEHPPSSDGYALPESIAQSQATTTTPPVYSKVMKNAPVNDVNAAYSDITGATPSEHPPSSETGKESPSTAPIYANAPPAAAVGGSDDQQSLNGPPITMKGKPGWVENIIYA